MYAIYQLLQIGLSKFVGLPPVIIGVDTQILMIQFEISEICRTFRKLSFFATPFSSWIIVFLLLRILPLSKEQDKPF